jgi:hypothetical protein
MASAISFISGLPGSALKTSRASQAAKPSATTLIARTTGRTMSTFMQEFSPGTFEIVLLFGRASLCRTPCSRQEAL